MIFIVGAGLYAVMVAGCAWIVLKERPSENWFQYYRLDSERGGYFDPDGMRVEKEVLWRILSWYGIVVLVLLLSPLLLLWVIVGEPRFPKVEALFKRKEAPVLFSGGDGSSRDAAVVITVDDPRRGISAEYNFIQQQHGPREVEWKRDMQVKIRSRGRQYDVISIVLAGGEKKTYWFDITQLRW